MGDLDFSDLSDDQLVGLIRSALQEAVRRHPGVQAAAQAAVLDEAEKAKIRVESANREAAAQRARERERIAAEAAAKVRAEAAAANAEAEAARERSIRESQAREAANKAAVAKARAEAQALFEVAASLAREAVRRSLLSRAAQMVGLNPGEISLVVYKTSVYINRGSDRFSRDHLVSYRDLELSTKRSLMGRKGELLPFCAELRANYNDVHIDGSQYFSETEATA